MTKQRMKMLKMATSFTLVLMLFISTAMPVFAGDDDFSKGTENDPATAAITKMLKMPIETITPDIEFKFEFTPKSLDWISTNPALVALVPPIEPLIISFSAINEGESSSDSGLKLVPKEGMIPFDVTKVDRAGVYGYTVKEFFPTYDIDDPFKEELTYSVAEYDLEIWVENGENELYVFAIVAKILINDEYNINEPVGTKVDPTPEGGSNTDYDFSQMVFTNVYQKNNGKEKPKDPDEIDKFTVLSISKKVTGNFADFSKLFEFNVTVDKPATATKPGIVYRAYVIEGTTKSGISVVTSTSSVSEQSKLKDDLNDNGSSKGYKYIEFTPGELLKVYLSDGQRLAFTDLPVGSSFMSEEQAIVDYTPSYILVQNGDKKPEVVGTQGNALGFSKQWLGEEENKADFSNAYRLITPTGIAVDTLPYAVLIAFALMALIGYMVIRNRRNAKYYDNV